MARNGVTEADVGRVADALLRQGERPTIERIRAELGTGSPNTVLRHLDQWWLTLGRRLDERETQLKLPSVPPAVANAVSALWVAALGEAETHASTLISTERQELESERVELEQRRRHVKAELEAMEKSLADTQAARRLAESRLSDLQALSEELRQQLTEARNAREASQSSVKVMQEKLEQIRSTLEHANTQRAELQLEHEKRLRATEDRWMREVDRARLEASTVSSKLKSLEKESRDAARAAASELASLRQSLRTSERAAAASQARAEVVESRLKVRDVATPQVRGAARKAPAPRPSVAKKRAARVRT